MIVYGQKYKNILIVHVALERVGCEKYDKPQPGQ